MLVLIDVKVCVQQQALVQQQLLVLVVEHDIRPVPVVVQAVVGPLAGAVRELMLDMLLLLGK